ncbi:hypothetical protein T08_14629 [Trichinella sp. T8]|nr:hypothetical protein T08_14629 [Trichinella sp. T8]
MASFSFGLIYRIVLLKNTLHSSTFTKPSISKKNQYCTRWVGLPWLKPMMIFLLQQQHDVMSRVHTYAEHCLKGGLERVSRSDDNKLITVLSLLMLSDALLTENLLISKIASFYKNEGSFYGNLCMYLLTDWIDENFSVKVVNLKSRLLGQLSFICNLAEAEQSPSNNAHRLSTLFVHCSFAIAIDMSVSLRHCLIHTLYWNVNILQSEHNFPGLDCTSKGM